MEVLRLHVPQTLQTVTRRTGNTRSRSMLSLDVICEIKTVWAPSRHRNRLSAGVQAESYERPRRWGLRLGPAWLTAGRAYTVPKTMRRTRRASPADSHLSRAPSGRRPCGF